MTTILLSGGQGFLGRRTLGLLLEKGFTVRALTRRAAPELVALGVEVIQANLRDLPGVMKAVRGGVDGVVHCAARSGVWGPLEDYLADNYTATANLMWAAKEAGAGWFVHTSSPSVIHTGAPLDGIDESAPYAAHPSRPYPYSKMLAEKLVLGADTNTFRTVALRPHLIWGLGDPHFLPRLLKKARAGRLRLPKTTALVDGTYIDNAAQALVLATEKMVAGGIAAQIIGGQAYFISQGEPLTAFQLISKLLEAASGGQLQIKGEVPAWVAQGSGVVLEKVWGILRLKSEPPLTSFVAEELTLPHWFKLDRARNDLGYIPEISLAEGLARLAEGTLQK